LQTTVEAGNPPRDITVIIRTSGNGRAEGKFVFGLGPHPVVVFDDTAAFHRDLGARYKVRPLGGGWIVMDAKKKTVQVSGRSTQYGRERERDLTVEALSLALPEYRCLRLD